MNRFPSFSFLFKRDCTEFVKQLVNHVRPILMGGFFLTMVTAGSVSYLSLVSPGKETARSTTPTLSPSLLKIQPQYSQPNGKLAILGIVILTVGASYYQFTKGRDRQEQSINDSHSSNPEG
jgi:hypothetical protein